MFKQHKRNLIKQIKHFTIKKFDEPQEEKKSKPIKFF